MRTSERFLFLDTHQVTPRWRYARVCTTVNRVELDVILREILENSPSRKFEITTQKKNIAIVPAGIGSQELGVRIAVTLNTNVVPLYSLFVAATVQFFFSSNEAQFLFSLHQSASRKNNSFLRNFPGWFQ